MSKKFFKLYTALFILFFYLINFKKLNKAIIENFIFKQIQSITLY